MEKQHIARQTMRMRVSTSRRVVEAPAKEAEGKHGKSIAYQVGSPAALRRPLLPALLGNAPAISPPPNRLQLCGGLLPPLEYSPPPALQCHKTFRAP